MACEPYSSVFSWLSFIIIVLWHFSIVYSCEHGKLSPDPENCSNYLQCNHNTQVVRPCPQGLLFNPTTSTCDWPQNVECGGSESGNDGDETESSTSGNGVTGSPQISSSTMKPTSIPSTPLPPPPSELPTSSVHFAPYYDVNMNGPSLTQVYSETGQKDFTLAFALGSSEGCKPKWGGVTDIDDPGILGPIRKLQSIQGNFIVATGGAMGPYFEQLCSNVEDLANAYKTVLDAVGTNHIDVDIESTVDADRMNKALAQVQRERPNTTVSYTLMVQAEDYGLTPALGVDILRNAKANGVQVTTVNPMTMEFGGPSPDFGDSVIGAANSVLQQMKQIWPEKSTEELKGMLGVTPMLGRNFNGKVFTLEHARKLVNWANKNSINFLAFWSIGRDFGTCPGGSISPSCSSISQKDYEFTKIFQNFRR